MVKITPRLLLFLLVCVFLGNFHGEAQGINTKKNYVRVDQFGYMENATKMAIIAKAVNGFNAGTGIDLNVNVNVQLRKNSDNAIVYQARATVWNGGGTDELSGDRGWYFDFSSYTTPGTYYIRVTETNGNTVDSNRFKIDDNVYDDVLRVAMESFFYQRIGQNKTASHASGSDWVDGPWYLGTNQDTNAKYLYSNERRNVGKGWIDAGDPNKYVTFATPAVHNLLTTYQQHENFWKSFSLRIPENNNDLPDILDEIKWEVDWVVSMQRNDGTVHAKAGIKEDGAYVSPPSTDSRERWYSQTCPAAAITASGMMAHAAVVLRDFPSQSSYVSDLTSRAELSWDAYTNASDKDAICDNGEIEAGDADGPGNQYLLENVAEAVCAAVYLYDLTGKSKYNDFVKNNYTQIRSMFDRDWAIYRANQGESLLYYTTLSNADNAVKNAIIDRKNTSISRQPTIYKVDPSNDFYGFDPFYLNWGSNSLIARQGSDNYDYINYGLDSGNHNNYREVSDNILHYFHGINPFGISYLTNMYNYGGDFSVDQMWHTWFFNEGKYDGTPNGSNIVGPAPGFVTGGANPVINRPNTVVTIGGVKYNGQTVGNQPGLKAFADENDYIVGESEAPYALVENGIYYQASYVKMLANYVANGGGGSNPGPDPDPVTEGSQEIEGNFTVFNEAGTSFSIGVDGSNPGASNGQYVRLFDIDDELSTTFSVGEAGDYKIDLRVRTGEQSANSTSNMVGNYEVRIDGTVRTFSFVSGSASALDGDTYWGLISHTRNLSAGSHTIRIKAKGPWLKADRLDFAKTSGGGSGDVFGEVGTSSTNANWKTVNYANSYTDPVVVMGPLGMYGGQAATVRVRNSGGTNFQWQVDEWEYLDQSHNAETVGYMVVEKGTHTMANGNKIIAGKKTTGTAVTTVTFSSAFSAKPTVLVQAVTNNEAQAINVRVRKVTNTGFELYIQEEENGGTLDGNRSHVNETVAWVAMERGSANGSGVGKFEVVNSANEITDQDKRISFSQTYNSNNRVLIGHSQTTDGGDAGVIRYRANSTSNTFNATGIDVFFQEEASKDAELAHATEVFGYIVFDGKGNLTGSGSGGSGNIVVRAKGDCGTETMQLRVDGTTVQTWNNVSTSFTNYTYNGFTSGAVSIHFTNDGSSGSCTDKNLEVDWIEICGARLQTETASTKTSTCCATSLDKLFTNGNFAFGSQTCGSVSLKVAAAPEEAIAENVITFFPNPVRGGVINLVSQNNFRVRLLDLLGREVFNSPEMQAGTQELNLDGLHSGLYILQMTDELTKKSSTSKLIIE